MLQFGYQVPEQKRIRLIINSDVANEADDQFALVHALLSPRFIIKGVIAAHFGVVRSATSMQDSYAEAQKVLQLMDLPEVPLVHGAAHALPDEATPVMSEGAELIIREAMADDPRPLYVVFLGPLTDMAAAYLEQPAIAGRVNVIWIGGRDYPAGGIEFNLQNDIHAANVIFGSPLSLWQVPRNVYTTIRVSLAELEYKVKPCGPLGQYLFEQMLAVNQRYAERPRWPLGEAWSLGDSPAISLLLDPHEYCYDWVPAPRIAADMHYIHEQNQRPIRVYRSVDARFTLEDMFAKIALHFGTRHTQPV